MKYIGKNYWLMKSEAEMFSINDFKKEKRTIWTEVRNYQARNLMRDGMTVGDYFLFYHSSSEPTGVAGLGIIAKTGIPDPTALDKTSEYFDKKATLANNPWVTVEVKFIEMLPRVITLAEIKLNPILKKMTLVQKGSRLSIQPVKKEEFMEILKML
jgi:predicted RNA-binding protein with PUA-like domain